MNPLHKKEVHYSHRNQWLRAAVLGANDGIVSTASLILGLSAAQIAHADMIVAGLAALVAGSMSMAAGEYVSVSSQADSEQADLSREKHELAVHQAHEHRELTNIYVERGLDENLAQQVATQLTAHDALSAHARDELGLTDHNTARPLLAATASACAFAAGAALPVLLAAVSSTSFLNILVASGSLLTLASLGAVAAYAGGAGMLKGAVRVTLWGALAMAATTIIGSWVGTVV